MACASKLKSGNEQPDEQPSTSGRTPEAAVANVRLTRPRQNNLANALSGALSGALISACVQPLDVLRTRMQAEAARGMYRSTLQTFSSVISELGPRGLWQGTTASVLRLGSGAGLHFMLLENFKTLLGQRQEDGTLKLGNAQAALTGGLSRACAAVVSCPFTVIKTRMEYSTRDSVRYSSVRDALATIVRAEGPRGLFRGLMPTVYANAPFSALYYMFYRQIREALSGSDRPEALITFTSGGVAAVAATLVTQPFDVIRTRMQLRTSSQSTAISAVAEAAARGAQAASSTAAAARQMGSMAMLMQVLREGPRSLLAGMLPRVLKRTCQTALVWTLYEELTPRLAALALHAAPLVQAAAPHSRAAAVGPSAVAAPAAPSVAPAVAAAEVAAPAGQMGEHCHERDLPNKR